jgi:hypothetical protein
VEAGGKPDYYTRWVNDAFKSALDSRGERMLQKALNSPSNPNVAAIGRLLDSQTDINEDDTATDDYGREAAIDQVIQQSWETNPDPTEGSFLNGSEQLEQ